jgi:hypothetical protein
VVVTRNPNYRRTDRCFLQKSPEKWPGDSETANPRLRVNMAWNCASKIAGTFAGQKIRGFLLFFYTGILPLTKMCDYDWDWDWCDLAGFSWPAALHIGDYYLAWWVFSFSSIFVVLCSFLLLFLIHCLLFLSIYRKQQWNGECAVVGVRTSPFFSDVYLSFIYPMPSCCWLSGSHRVFETGFDDNDGQIFMWTINNTLAAVIYVDAALCCGGVLHCSLQTSDVVDRWIQFSKIMNSCSWSLICEFDNDNNGIYTGPRWMCGSAVYCCVCCHFRWSLCSFGSANVSPTRHLFCCDHGH